MIINLNKVGALVVRNGEAITGIRRKIDGISRLAGFSVVDSNRLAVAVSEAGRRLLSAEPNAIIGVYLHGRKTIDGLALFFPRNKVVSDILSQSNYFDHITQTEEDGSKSILALKYSRGVRTALDKVKLRQCKELLSRLNREELMGELQTKNEELEAHRANLERTVAERTASLSEKEAQLRLAMDNMTDGIYVLDESQNFVLFNEQYVKQVDLPKGTVEVGEAVKKVVHAHASRGDYGPGEVDDLVKERLQSLASPESRQDEVSIHGGRRTLHMRKASLDGRGAVVIATDITERKEAELENERLRRGLEASGVGTWSVDMEAGTAEWDDCSLEIYGLTREQFDADLGAWEKSLHPDDREKTLKRLEELNEEGATAYDTEYRIVRPSGEVRHVLAEGTFERDGKGKLLYHTGTHRDITKRKEAEEEIRRSQEQISSIFGTATDGILSLDSVGHIVASNEALSKLCGHSEKELVGKFAGLIVPEQLQDATAKGINRIFGGNIENLLDQVSEGRLLRKDGTVIPIDFSLAEWETKDSTFYTCIIRDVTEKRRQEEALREARDAAEDATRSKDMFLAAMSHEIRTPMNGVVGMIELLQGTALADDQRRMLETAKDSSFALLTIINDILDFSKIEAGKMEIEEVAFDLRRAADAVGEMLGGVMAAEKGLPLIVHIQPEVPSILIGDQVRIRQILFNLAGNAIKFTEDGEVHVGISVAKTHKDGSVDILYEVKDSGIGMTEEQVSRLFKPFEQAEASTTRQYGGTGLGLSIVLRLSELMKGKVEVESKSGKGSIFRVTIRHKVPEEAGETTAPDLGRMKMLALSPAGSRMDLLSQLLEENDEGLIDRLVPRTKPATLLKKLAAAERAGDPYRLVYLSLDVGTGEQDQLRKKIEGNKELKSIPRFLVERHNTPITQDVPGSVLIPVTPYTESNLVRALAIALGKASPDIVGRAEIEGQVAEVPTIEEAEAAGTLVLVADDNETNQEVISRQLTVFGYAHEIAEDGEIALQMLSKRTYGLLLSDVHMPNMDGYQLTQAIRKKEKKSGTRLPIVAVTANALQGEGDRCLDVGMDDYMAKPVRIKEMRNCLNKWLPKGVEVKADASTGEDEGAAAAAEGDTPDNAVVELANLMELVGNNEEAIDSILSKIPPAAWEAVENIEKGLKANDLAAVGDAGHKLKSSARSIGANKLADICEGLEEAGQAADKKTIERLVPKLRPAVEEVIAYIKERTNA